MKVYLRDYLSSTADSKKVTSAFHYFNRQNGSGGYLIGLIASTSEIEFEATNINRFVWNGIVDEFSSAEEGSIERMKKTVASGKMKMLELLRNSDGEDEGVDLNISLVHFVGNTVYFGFFGNSEIHIYHDDELVDVSKVLQSSKVNVGSTLITGDDVIALSSGQFWEDNNIETSDYKVFKSLLSTVEKKKIKLGGGVLFTSTGVDFEPLLIAEDPEILDTSSAVLPSVIDLDGKEEDLELTIPEEDEASSVVEEDLSAEIETPDQENGEDQSVDDEATMDEKNGETVGDEKSDTEEKDTLNVEDQTKKQVDTNPLDEVSDAYEAVEYEESEFDNSSLESSEDNTVKKNRSSGATNGSQDPYSHSYYDEDTVKQDPEKADLDSGEYNKFSIYKKAYLRGASIVGLSWIYLSRGASKLDPRSKDEYQSVPIGQKAKNMKSYADRYFLNPYGRKSWYKKTKAKVSQSKISSSSLGGMKVGGYRERSLRRKRFLILGSLALVLVAGFLGVKQASKIRDNMQIHSQFTQFYEESKRMTDKALRSVGTDAEAAELALFQVEKKIDEFDVEKDRLNKEDQSLMNDLEQSVLGISDELDKVTVVNDDNDNFSLFFDARIESTEGSRPTDIAIYKDEKPIERLVVVDQGKKVVYLISTYDQSVTPIADPEGLLEEPRFVDVGVSGIFVYDEVNGVLKAPFEDVKSKVGALKSLSGVSVSDFPFEQADEFAVFTQNDNIYLMDSETEALYKATRTSSGSYGLPFLYFTDPLLSGALDFFADFSTYVTGEGEHHFSRLIFDYVNNKLVNSPLTIKGARKELGPIPAGYTGGSLDQKLYIFDRDTKMVMAFEKPDENTGRHLGELHLRSQYAYRGDRSEVFEDVQDLVVDTDENRIFVLDGTRVWSLKID